MNEDIEQINSEPEQEVSTQTQAETGSDEAPKESRKLRKKKKSSSHKGKGKKVKKKKGIQISAGSIMLILFCSFLIVVATFLQLEITHLIIPLKIFTGKPCHAADFLYTIKYIPQIPVIIFIVGFLGRKMGLVSILLYIMAGLLFLPIFALGGGWKYIFEYGFGYIFAYIPAASILGSILKKNYSYKNVAKAVFLSVITIHLFGIAYMTVIALFKHSGLNFVGSWIAAQSGVKILYDLVFSYLAVLVAKYARIILWLYL